MSTDLHDMDEVFNSAYKQLSEDPSRDAWEKISAGLDKKDASSYKRKLKTWKRVAVLSLILLSGSILYETLIVKSGSDQKNTSLAINTKKRRETAEQKDQEINQRPAQPGRPAAEIPNSVTRKILIESEGNNLASAEKFLESTDIKSKRVTEFKQPDVTTVPFSPTRNDNKSLNGNGYSLTKDIVSPSVQRKSTDLAVMLRRDHIQPSYLNIIPGSSLNKSNSIFDPYWTISAFVSSDRPGYHLDKDKPAITKIKEHEEHQLSLSAGILVARQFNRRLALQSGLIYSNTEIVISPQQIYASPDQTGKVLYKYIVSSGYAYIKPGFASVPSPGDSLTAEDGQHSLKYLTVPLMLKYKLINGSKWILSPGVGIAGNFLASEDVETDVEGSSNQEHVSIRKLDGLRTFNWSVMGDVTMEYLASKRISINLRSFFSYALSPITRNNDVETFPYSVGLGAGVTYRF